ncbi:Endo-1,4-beta-xylanase B precursor [Acidisarcina polymorpha]|uniref:Endo-1,4-beta-xylanase B n=1 Tax=Acidisarcina polymorpha TaxID=2211140 RepID=A0A2Z5G579_9BACT|nr:alpha/beta hydrolase [Acidisarcina polymorpha]AXC14231.1 Endo-1,4-beta-xylanase B precursor [Acidisarcina polymorpha]
MKTIYSVRQPVAFLSLAFFVSLGSAQQAPIKLWPQGAPGSPQTPTPGIVRTTPQGDHVVSNVHEPSITPYFPPANTATGAAIIVAPGGGHSELWVDHEGYAVSKWLSDHGVAAFVLKYRLAKDKNSTYTIEGTELADIERAIRIVRGRSKEWGINAEHIGVMGFSAGGELAELASTRYDEGMPSAADPIDRVSSKPNFQALLYPALVRDARLTGETPPAFLACGGNDRPDISQGLPELYLALTRLHVPAELHIYAGIGHGFGVRQTNTAPVSGWTTLLLQWLDAQGFLHSSKAAGAPG